jgi:hypothetical protein
MSSIQCSRPTRALRRFCTGCSITGFLNDLRGALPGAGLTPTLLNEVVQIGNRLAETKAVLRKNSCGVTYCSASDASRNLAWRLRCQKFEDRKSGRVSGFGQSPVCANKASS